MPNPITAISVLFLSKTLKTNSSLLLKAFNKRDEFVLRVLDKNKTEIAVIGLGNPFYIHAQHIDHEESKDFGTYIDNQDINAVIPLGQEV